MKLQLSNTKKRAYIVALLPIFTCLYFATSQATTKTEPSVLPSDVTESVVAVDVVAMVNNVTISRAQFDVLAEARKAHLSAPGTELDTGAKPLSNQLSKQLPKDVQQKLVDDLVLTEMLAQEANKRGVNKLPRLLAEAEIQYKTLLGQTLIQEEIATMVISDDEIQQRYDAIPVSYKYGIRRIKVASETQANTILDELKNGADFADMADTYSSDAKVNKGGWLGNLRLSQLGGYLATAVQELKDGNYYQTPIKVGSDWTLILVESRESQGKPPFGRAQEWLRSEIQQTRVQAMLADLRQNARVELYVP